MKIRVKMILATAALSTALGAGVAIGVAVASQPHMDAALADLQAAKGELQVAEANKAGHRVNALNLVNQAISEVQAGIAAAD
ncbi:MAG: hypothetical protein ACHP7N_12555 [Caulobacterales bacterium]